jgi:hypothetical protein
MKVQAFIPDWPGPKQHAAATAQMIAAQCRCDKITILDNPAHYFTEQWNEMLDQFTGDIAFWCMADVFPPKNLSQMYDRALQLMSDNVGIYAPDVSWTGQKLFRPKMREVFPGVYDTPCTDMLCWFIHKDVLKLMPRIDPKINRFGWGIEYVAIAAARVLKKIAVRDYNFVASHVRGGNYNNDAAAKQFQDMLLSLQDGWYRVTNSVYNERQEVGVRLVTLLIGGKGMLQDSLYYLLNLADKDVTMRCDSDWHDLIKDAQDVYYLEEGVPDDLVKACKENSITNLWFRIPQDPKLWNGPNQWHWRHPKYPVSLTERMGMPVGWILPSEVKLD